MRINPVGSNPISFKYSNKLKTLFKAGDLPTVKHGFYGDELDIRNVSLEHLKPKSQGGLSKLFNYVLASPKQNNARSDKDLVSCFNPDAAKNYLKQFTDVEVKGFIGNSYIKMILNTLKELGIDISFYE